MKKKKEMPDGVSVGEKHDEKPKTLAINKLMKSENIHTPLLGAELYKDKCVSFVDIVLVVVSKRMTTSLSLISCLYIASFSIFLAFSFAVNTRHLHTESRGWKGSGGSLSHFKLELVSGHS